jgi:hypothetical protein
MCYLVTRLLYPLLVSIVLIEILAFHNAVFDSLDFTL